MHRQVAPRLIIRRVLVLVLDIFAIELKINMDGLLEFVWELIQKRDKFGKS